MSMNQNRQGEAQQENSQQMGDSLSGSIQAGQNQQSTQVGGREGGEQSSQEGAEQTLQMDQGNQQSASQGNAQRGQPMPVDPEEKPADQLTPDELRLMADTMPGEGPGDD